MNYEDQIKELNTLVESKFIKRADGVTGPFTSGDYVKWKLNQIFGPNNWNHMITKGPELITLNDQSAYVEAVVRLTVEFADGKVSTHDDVGVWPLTATKNSGGLGNTKPERYETVFKAVVTDGLKACVESLGLCFRPLGDADLEKIIKGNGRSTGTGASTSSATSASIGSQSPATSTTVSPTGEIATHTNGNGNGNGKGNHLPTTNPQASTSGASTGLASNATPNVPVSPTTYYIAATGKYDFSQPVAKEIAIAMNVNTSVKNSDFAPAMAALPYFNECKIKGIEFSQAVKTLKECGLDIEKATITLCVQVE